MKKMAMVMLCAALLAGIPGVNAQETRPPTIFRFESDLTALTIGQLEAGDQILTLSWHVAHVTDAHRLLLYVYQDYGWVLINQGRDPLPPVGSLPVEAEHPRNFGPLSYRLSVTTLNGRVLDERTLVIPYDMAAMAGAVPTIDSFIVGSPTIDAATMAAGDVRIQVSWEVSSRWPLTNLVFEQVLGGDEDQAQNVELPRETLWVPSSGTGVVAPVQPPAGNLIDLRLRVVDVITADVYAEARVTISIIGTALPPEPAPPVETTPAPPPVAGDLTVLDDCSFNAANSPLRGWVDGPGIPSPDTLRYAYATNAMNEAKLIIARSDGSGQVVVEAPSKGIPLGIQPRWSPDSQRIAFANIALSQPGGGTIYVVKVDGTDLRRVAEYVGYYDDLAWSADGTLLYFSSGETSGAGSGTQVGNYKVYAVTTDGFGTPQVVADGCGVRS
jgi:hypothetical protein